MGVPLDTNAGWWVVTALGVLAALVWSWKA